MKAMLCLADARCSTHMPTYAQETVETGVTTDSIIGMKHHLLLFPFVLILLGWELFVCDSLCLFLLSAIYADVFESKKSLGRDGKERERESKERFTFFQFALSSSLVYR